MSKIAYEFLDATHPLIQWIRHEYDASVKDSNQSHPFHGVSALEIENSHVDCIPGTYIYVIHLWEFRGLRSETRLAFRAIRLEDEEKIFESEVEALLDKALNHGETKPNAANLVNQDEVMRLYNQCEEELQVEFLDFEDEFEQENTDRCNVQEQSIRAYTERKRRDLEERIERLRLENKIQPISGFEGQIRKSQQNCEVGIKKIDQKRKYQSRNPELAAGLIFVTKAN